MKALLQWIAALALGLTVHTARAGQYSDLWWNPQESGWGVNVVQQLETAFVTLFVYGPDRQPVWYVAPDARVIAYTSSGLPLFVGTLYRTAGPWQGGAFDPSQVVVTPVGQVSLEVLARDRMRVSYGADGAASVTKEVVRQTWQLPLAAANYSTQFVLRQSVPGSPPYGTHVYQADVLIHFDPEAGNAFMRADDALGIRCEYRGPFRQSGKLSTIDGTFSCDGGDLASGTFEATDIEVSEHGITGYLRMTSPTANAYGRFAGARL